MFVLSAAHARFSVRQRTSAYVSIRQHTCSVGERRSALSLGHRTLGAAPAHSDKSEEASIDPFYTLTHTHTTPSTTHANTTRTLGKKNQKTHSSNAIRVYCAACVALAQRQGQGQGQGQTETEAQTCFSMRSHSARRSDDGSCLLAASCCI